MDKHTPWVTVIALYSFAAFLGGVLASIFLVAVGAVDISGMGVVDITLRDVAAPTISALGIVVTALIAAKGWELQRKDKRAEGELRIRERRNAAKVDRMRLAHILSEITAGCKIYIEELLDFAENFPDELPITDRYIPVFSMPETVIDKIIAVAAKQEEPLLSALGELSHVMQMKQARSIVYQETLGKGGTRGVKVILNGKAGGDQIADFTHKEMYEALVIYSRCLVLFEPARYFRDEPYTGKVEPDFEDFENSMKLSGVAFYRPACEAVLKQLAKRSRVEL
ncbi:MULTISPECIES: hypothetical protein [unclassified Thalassospira]|uniref:hypothetical protein n=1 Tax=unclassified Thalassospira TaxID=2648997 RepID=UPI0007A5B3C4|nr:MULTISPECIES: hypothetical protein [unclassified Thalassospira]KZD00465.1 hypothetical protein AUQ41_07765 [Thalassospira sp. MCCC 1A02898]ONH87280.1 hypothetical protein TH47_11930 [Thalassospira sp. MCCC 1A02803]